MRTRLNRKKSKEGFWWLYCVKADIEKRYGKIMNVSKKNLINKSCKSQTGAYIEKKGRHAEPANPKEGPVIKVTPEVLDKNINVKKS